MVMDSKKSLDLNKLVEQNNIQQFPLSTTRVENISGLDEHISAILLGLMSQERENFLKEIGQINENRRNENTRENHNLLQNTMENLEGQRKKDRMNMDKEFEHVGFFKFLKIFRNFSF